MVEKHFSCLIYFCQADDVLLFIGDSDDQVFMPSKTRSGCSTNAIVLNGLAALSAVLPLSERAVIAPVNTFAS